MNVHCGALQMKLEEMLLTKILQMVLTTADRTALNRGLGNYDRPWL
jgi:hypothetical protein